MTTTQVTKAEVNTAVHSVTFITNTVMQVAQRIIHKRKLDPTYFQQSYSIIENGLRTWLTEHKLKSFMIQVYVPGSSKAVENWSTVFEYRATPDSEVHKPPIQQVEEFSMKLAELPAGATYQIFAEVAPDASHVAGWAPGTPLPIFGKSRKDFVKWGYGNIGAGLEYEGGTGDEDGPGGPGRHP